MDFDLNNLEDHLPRERAELETNRDLSKPLEQLVCDFHDMAELVINPNDANAANINWFMIQAQKRMVSLMGRVAIEHERSSKRLVNLTWALGGLTVALFLATLLLLCVARQTDDQLHQIHTLIETHAKQPTDTTTKQQ